MTKAEAVAINALLPQAHSDIQEVVVRIKMHGEGKITLNAEWIEDSINRLNKSVEAIVTVTKMASAELG